MAAMSAVLHSYGPVLPPVTDQVDPVRATRRVAAVGRSAADVGSMRKIP